MIAAVYLCRDNGFDVRTTRAVRDHVDRYVAARPGVFCHPVPTGPAATTTPLVETLAPHVGELRAVGHHVIYAAIALRVLHDQPELATAPMVEGLRRLLSTVVQQSRAEPDTRWNREHPLHYGGPDGLVTATCDAILRPHDHLRRAGAGHVLHWVTVAESLLMLEELGHRELSRAGYPGHALYINRPRDLAAPAHTVPAEAEARAVLADASYWESEAPHRPRRNSWGFGHAFKLPYSLFRLLRRVDDVDRRRACLDRGAWLNR